MAEQRKMADLLVNIEACIATAVNLGAAANGVFETLLNHLVASSTDRTSVVLGDIAKVDNRTVRVKADHGYRLAGVLNGGRGLVDKGRLRGSDTNYAVLHSLQTNQLVMRKLTAWEGPIAVVPPEFEHACVSTEFPTFALDVTRVLPEYMRYVCQSPWFWNEMKARCTGTALRRMRLNQKNLLAIPMWLPPLERQRTTVDVLDAVYDAVTAAELRRASYMRLKLAFLGQWFGPSPTDKQS
jgi:type I restriction enzyme S subunit